MALTAYQNQTQNLLQLPSASPSLLYPTANITTWINIARGQLAGEGECIRFLATVQTIVGQRNYAFSALNTGVAATTGIQGAIHVRRLMFNQASGQKWIAPRAWEWFDLYHMNNPVPQNGPPNIWAQYAQGALGSFYLDPPPDTVYTITADCVCYPQNLALDTDVEAIPYLWSDAVPYFAAYLALLSSQTSARRADAEAMFQLYQQFVGRARQFANPSVNRPIYQQSGDPAQASAYGLQAVKGAA